MRRESKFAEAWELRSAPERAGSTIEGRGNHPVVNITYEDGQAYAEWAGHTLSSEVGVGGARRPGRRDLRLGR